jgi:hypothetical protein
VSLFFIRHEVPILGAGPLGQFGESSCRYVAVFVFCVVAGFERRSNTGSRPDSDSHTPAGRWHKQHEMVVLRTAKEASSGAPVVQCFCL